MTADANKSSDKGAETTAASASFDTVLTAFGNNTGIVVPSDLVEKLGSGKRPPVSVDINGHTYRNTIAVMSGQHLVSVSAAIRKATGLTAGDAIHVTLTVDSSPREIDISADFQAALNENPAASEFFDKLTSSLKRYHVDNVNGAKTEETRRRRIDRSVELFSNGKQR